MPDWKPKRCVVVGASGAIGRAFVEQLLRRPDVELVYGLSRSAVEVEDSRFLSLSVDYQNPQTLQKAAETIAKTSPLDLVIVATGLLHAEDGFGPEKSLRQLDADALSRAYLINAVGPMLVAKSFLPLMVKTEKSVFAVLSARVGSISDNRIGGWYGYRAAKAALNQMIRTAAIEQARRWPQGVIVGLHPGTVDSNLSKPFQRNVSPEKLFSPQQASAAMLSVLERLEADDSGKVFAYDGSEVPA